VKKRQEAESDAQRYSSKLRKQESILEKQKEDIRALQDDVDRLRDKYEKELSTQQDTILDREGTIQDLRLHTDRLKADLVEAEEAKRRSGRDYNYASTSPQSRVMLHNGQRMRLGWLWSDFERKTSHELRR